VTRISLAALVLLAACNQIPADSSTKGATKVPDPVGRFQMQQGVNPASIAVLDTRKGTLQNCFLVNERYHCLSQDRSAGSEGGIPDSPKAAN
jgi:hypothetical protein